MKMRVCCKRFCPQISCKQAGLGALTFCLGMLAGLLLPIYIVVVIETAMLILLGYFCLFHW